MTWAAVALGLFQLVFLWNIHWSARRGAAGRQSVAGDHARMGHGLAAAARQLRRRAARCRGRRIATRRSRRERSGRLVDRADRDARAADVAMWLFTRVDRDVRRPRWSRATCCCAPGARPGRRRGGTTAPRPSPIRGSGCCGWSSPRSRLAPPRATPAARARRRGWPAIRCRSPRSPASSSLPGPYGRTGAHRRRSWTGLAQCAGHVVRAERRRRRAGAGRRGRDDRRGAGHRRIRRAAAAQARLLMRYWLLMAACFAVVAVGMYLRMTSSPRLPGVRPAARFAAHRRPARRRRR